MTGTLILIGRNSWTFVPRSNTDLLEYKTIELAVFDYPNKGVNLAIMVLLKCIFNTNSSLLAVETVFKTDERPSSLNSFVSFFIDRNYSFLSYSATYKHEDLADKSVTLCYIYRFEIKLMEIALEFFDKSRKKLNKIRLEKFFGKENKEFSKCFVSKETNRVFEEYFSKEREKKQLSVKEPQHQIKKATKQNSLLTKIKHRASILLVFIPVLFILLVSVLIKRCVDRRRNDEKFLLKLEKILEL